MHILLRMTQALTAGALLMWGSAAIAQQAGSTIIFEDVRIFDGKSDALSEPANVIVKDGKIDAVSSADVDEAGAEVIDGEGKVLMPGLIDAHWHTTLIMIPPDPAKMDVGYANIAAGVQATRTLMRGFTTVRDLGGASFGLKRAIDQGLVPGPRIYPRAPCSR